MQLAEQRDCGPLVSVVIPAYNEQRRIRGTIRSVLANAQNFPHFEIVVVNNASIDTTETEVTLAQEDAKRAGINLRLIRQVEPGPAPTRNEGAKQAQGEYLFFLDADTIINDTFLRRNIEQMRANRLVAAGAYMKPDSGKCIDKLLVGTLNQALSLVQYTKRAGAFGAALFVKRDLFNQLGGFDPGIDFGEDIEFVRRAVKQGHRFRMLSSTATTSARRAEKHGRLTLLIQATRLILYSTYHGTTKGSRIKYEYGNFD